MRRSNQAWGLVLIVLACSAGVRALPQAQKEPLTKEQVLSLVRNQLGDATGARAIRERGIDFEPTEDFLGALKNVGASDEFIEALKAAKRPTVEEPGSHPPAPATHPGGVTPGSPPTAPTAMDEFQVLDLLISAVPSARMAALVMERGISFSPHPFVLSTFQSLGAKDDFLNALRGAKEYSPDVSARRRHAQMVEADYTETLRRGPKNRAVRFGLGVALMDQDKKEEMVAIFREGVRVEPNDAWSHAMLGTFLTLARSANYRAEAAQELRKAIQLNPSFCLAHLSLGELLDDENDRKGALGQLREAARLKPDWPGIHLKIALDLSGNGDHDGAVQEYRQETRLDPNNATVYFLLGMELTNDKNNPEEGSAAFRRACQLEPDNDVYHDSLGSALVQKGDKAAAWEEYRRAHELKPDDRDIRTRFETLSKELGK
ncbi:MAG: tetratricopeptide repeat protein [Terriglobia bacterium]